MKAITIVFFLILATPLVAAAQENGTGPGRSDGPGYRQFGRGGRMRGSLATTRPASVEEWDEAMAFLEKNSPERYKVLKDIDLSETSVLRAQILKKWENYKLISERFPELSDLGVQRFQLEDKIFGLTMKVRSDPGQSEVIKPQIHDLADKLVHVDIQEEQIRVKDLKKLLAAEEETLARKQANVSQLIEERTNRIMERMVAPPGGMHGMGDPRGSAGPDQLDALASTGLVLPDQIAQ